MRKRKDGKRSFYQWDWGSFYPQFDAFHIAFGPASYFDSRYYIHCFVSQIVALLIFPFIGFSWYSLLLLIPFFFNWGSLYLHIPGTNSKIDDCDPPQWGIYYYAEKNHHSVWLKMGKRTKRLFDMPWAQKWMRTSILRNDNTWEHEVAKDYPNADLYQKMKKDFWNKEEWGSILWSKTYPYTYILKSGEKQIRTATIRVEEREWRQRWLWWTSFGARIRRSIDIDFNDEVGEKTGSWKGGCVGCGYSMLPDETPEQCLRRMEKERKF